MATFGRATGKGGYSRGGGTDRLRAKHPADDILADTAAGYRAAYTRARDKAQAILHGYLMPRVKKADIERMTDKQKRDLWMKLFTGAAWLLARHRIAKIIVDVDVEAMEKINDAVPYAASEGWNRTLYDLTVTGNGGRSRGGGTGRLRVRGPHEPPPDVKGKKLNRGKDTRYIEKRIQSIAISVTLQVFDLPDIPGAIANMLTSGIRSNMDTTAQAVIFSANDTGAYKAGEAAVREGIDVEKTWLGIMDARIRDSHRHLHGTTLPMDGVFHGLHGDLRYPHDPDAPPAETMRCRCRLAIHLAGKSPGPYSYALLPTEVSKYQKWRNEQIRELSRQIQSKRARKGRR